MTGIDRRQVLRRLYAAGGLASGLSLTDRSDPTNGAAVGGGPSTEADAVGVTDDLAVAPATHLSAGATRIVRDASLEQGAIIGGEADEPSVDPPSENGYVCIPTTPNGMAEFVNVV